MTIEKDKFEKKVDEYADKASVWFKQSNSYEHCVTHEQMKRKVWALLRLALAVEGRRYKQFVKRDYKKHGGAWRFDGSRTRYYNQRNFENVGEAFTRKINFNYQDECEVKDTCRSYAEGIQEELFGCEIGGGHYYHYLTPNSI